MRITLTPLLLLLTCCGCHHNDTAADTQTGTRTPVTVTTVTRGPMEETVDVNAVSRFQLKTTVKATANGYLQSVNVAVGQYVSQGSPMFTIKTKEAQSLGNALNKLDTAFRFQGIIRIAATGNGYVTQLGHRAGDYVQDGDALATLADRNSLVFLLQLPYELKSLIANNHDIKLELPDGKSLDGMLGNAMPLVDSLSQTLSVPVRVSGNNENIPENLIAKVRLRKEAKPNAQSLPKAAVLTDEAQTAWWIMKLVNDSTAVKVNIRKGIETQDRVEIDSPLLNPNDRIVLTGNYGLSDTAGVVITGTNENVQR